MISYEVRCPKCGQYHDRWETFSPLREADADHTVLMLCFECEQATRVQPQVPTQAHSIAVASAR